VPEETVLAKARDVPFVGYNIFNTNALRLWEAYADLSENEDLE